MRMSMGLQAVPMQVMGMCCTECGHLLNDDTREDKKPASTSDIIMDEFRSQPRKDPNSVVLKKCPKCGREYLEDKPKSKRKKK